MGHQDIIDPLRPAHEVHVLLTNREVGNIAVFALQFGKETQRVAPKVKHIAENWPWLRTRRKQGCCHISARLLLHHSMRAIVPRGTIDAWTKYGTVPDK
jgi:hypothetical protein